MERTPVDDADHEQVVGDPRQVHRGADRTGLDVEEQIVPSSSVSATITRVRAFVVITAPS
jgi:hypothetical protein